MHTLMRVVSGVFLVTIGVAFLCEFHAFEHWVLRAPLVVLGLASVGFGIFVLVGRRGRPGSRL